MRAHRQTRNVVLGLTVAGLLALLGTFVAAPAADAAKRGKIKVCVAKKGPDKGAMRFSKKGKCTRGERKLSWSKKGKAGAQGAAGPQGPAGSAASVDELLALIESQQTTIDGLTQDVADLTTQVSTLAGQVLALEDILGGLTNAELTDAVGSVATVEALCTQMAAVTDQADDLGEALDGLGVNGALDALGGALSLAVPVPTALGPFSCPTAG